MRSYPLQMANVILLCRKTAGRDVYVIQTWIYSN